MMQDGIAQEEELGSNELYQHTSSKDWALRDSNDVQFPPRGVEIMQQAIGKNGRILVWTGLVVMLIIYQFDNALLYNYRNYATSAFNKVSSLGALGTASGIIFAVAKPPIAKLSDVIGRGETYLLLVTCMVISYILSASSKTFNTYAAGSIIYTFGQTGVNVMNDILISDFTDMRWRSFAIRISFFPFLVTPWISAYIVESVINGIGWRWGIGMFSILMPVFAALLVGTLLFYQRKSKSIRPKLQHEKVAFFNFCSQLDLGGSFLLCAGAAMFLRPFSLASLTPKKWDTPYVIVLLVLGAVTLICLVFYESLLARHPILPPKYLKTLR